MDRRLRHPPGDRAAARRIAERIERSVERHADDGSTIDVTAVTTAVDIVFGAAVDDAIACIDFADGRASFQVEPCAS